MDIQENNNDEISLIDLFAVLLKYKKLIIFTTFFAAVFIFSYSLISLKLPPEKSYMPDVYRPKALMLINDSSSQGGGLAGKLASSGLGSFASLMGASVGGGQTYSRLAIFLSTTNSFLDSVVDEFNLVERYKIKNHLKTESRKALSKNLKTKFDDKTGVFEISFEDIDPEFAQKVVIYCVKYYEDKFKALGLDKDKIEKENFEMSIKNVLAEIDNITEKLKRLETASMNIYGSNIPAIGIDAEKLNLELSAKKSIYAQLKSQYEMLKIKINSNTPILQILEYPEVPDQKSGPGRGKLCIVFTFAVFFFSIFLAFLLNAIRNIKNDPEAMMKLKGNKHEKK